jgi:hypothetical protein
MDEVALPGPDLAYEHGTGQQLQIDIGEVPEITHCYVVNNHDVPH